MQEPIRRDYAELVHSEGTNFATGWGRTGVTKLLLSPNDSPWVLCTLVLSFLCFYSASMFGKGTQFVWVREANLIAAVFFSISYCFVGLGLGLFEKENRLSRYAVVRLNALAWIVSLGITVVAMLFVLFMNAGRYALIFGSTGAFVGNVSFYMGIIRLLRNVPHRFVILGKQTKITDAIREFLSTSSLGHHYCDVWQIRNTLMAQDVPRPTALRELFDWSGISDLVLTRAVGQDSYVTTIAMQAMQGGVRVVDEVSFYSELCRRIPIEHLSVSWVASAGFDSQNPMKNLVKRSFDLLASTVALVVLSPVFLLVALLIKTSSAGPVFFKQRRQGRFSKPFNIIKFRTMYEQEAVPAATKRGDDRITKIGRVLRPLHLDELPQLWNILVGQMSFVGPRPEASDILQGVRESVPLFEVRDMIRPGLTGLAQISQGKTTFGKEEVERKLSFDLYYLKNYSIFFDLWIILRTALPLGSAHGTSARSRSG